MDRVTGEAVARHDGTVRPQAVAGVGADISQVTAVAGLVPLARTVEVEAAQLEGPADVPDAIEDDPVTLVGDRQTVIVAEIRRPHRTRLA